MSIEGNRNQGPFFRAGEPLSATKLNQLGELAGFGTTKHNTGSQTIQGPYGTVFMDSMGYSDNLYDYPFKITVGKNSSGTIDVYVRPGTVNNFCPKISGKYLDENPRPKLSFSSVSASKKKLVCLKATKDTVKFFPNTVEVVLLDDEEALVDSDNIGYLHIGTVTCSTTGGSLGIEAVYQFTYASQVLIRVKPGTATAIWSWSSR